MPYLHGSCSALWGRTTLPARMHAPYHPVGDGVLDVPHRRGTMPTSSRPCHSEPVRAAKQVPLGYTLAWESVSLVRRGEGAAALRHNVPSQIRVEKIAKSAILHKFRAECWLMCRNSENCVKSLANDMQRWYTYTIHRKYTIYGHPWVSALPPTSAAKQMAYLRNLILHGRVLK